MSTIPQRTASAFTVYCGHYGDVTKLAQDRKQSRQSLYREAERVADAVDGAAAQARIDELQRQLVEQRAAIEVLQERLSHAVEITPEKQGEFATVAQAEGSAAMLAWLEGLDLTANTRARGAWEEVVTYFRNQHHRMDYPTYLAKGWQIGSGPVEAACKLVINERLNGTGMRWGHGGADAMGHLRGLYLSEPSLWTAFWANRQVAA